jgi:hypothetical protein
VLAPSAPAVVGEFFSGISSRNLVNLANPVP